VAAQDQALQTKYYATKILNTQTDSKCRLCHQFDETIDHIISACPILAKEQYI
jgi:phospholipid N-methyltransferase